MGTEQSTWTFLTNHTHVLIVIAEDHDIRVRDIAEQVGITERAVQRIIHELVDAGYLTVEKHGRRNHYHVNLGMHLRHHIERHHTVSDLMLLGRDCAKQAV